MLTVARQASGYNVPLIGINKGGLGFLADIKPDVLQKKLKKILDGKYIKDKRIFFYLGLVYFELNKYDKSIDYYNKFLKILTLINGTI